jgi:hypothetical protein
LLVPQLSAAGSVEGRPLPELNTTAVGKGSPVAVTVMLFDALRVVVTDTSVMVKNSMAVPRTDTSSPTCTGAPPS